MLRYLIVLTSIIYAFNQQGEFDALLFKKYQKFMTKFGKSYSSYDELNLKFKIFKENYLNAKLENSRVIDSTGKLFGTTEFMDMSREEFVSNYLTLNQTELPKDAEIYFNQSTPSTNGRFLQSEEIPEEWDWTAHGAVNPVRNQGKCGACWAFTTISNVESVFYINKGKLPSFSEQQLIDCDESNTACIGGILHNAYDYVKNYGLQNLKDYPYAQIKQQCRYQGSESQFVIKGYITPGTTDEEKIKEFIYKVGPVGITINANLLQYYRGGVIDVPYQQCPYAPNHGVNIVGYGATSSGLKYWKVRNTWGAKWGEEGYFRIARGKGLCGVGQYVISALLK